MSVFLLTFFFQVKFILPPSSGAIEMIGTFMADPEVRYWIQGDKFSLKKNPGGIHVYMLCNTIDLLYRVECR